MSLIVWTVALLGAAHMLAFAWEALMFQRPGGIALSSSSLSPTSRLSGSGRSTSVSAQAAAGGFRPAATTCFLASGIVSGMIAWSAR